LTRYEKLHDYVRECEIHYVPSTSNLEPALAVRGKAVYGIIFNESFFATTAERYVALAHEKAHCETGMLYSINAPRLVKFRCEAQAWRQTIYDIVPLAELKAVLPYCTYDGNIDMCELAERFEVTPEFMWRALEHYNDLGKLC